VLSQRRQLAAFCQLPALDIWFVDQPYFDIYVPFLSLDCWLLFRSQDGAIDYDGRARELIGFDRFSTEAEIDIWRLPNRGMLVFAAFWVIAVVDTGCNSTMKTPIDPGAVKMNRTIAFDLYTHCGINQLKVNGKWF